MFYLAALQSQQKTTAAWFKMPFSIEHTLQNNSITHTHTPQKERSPSNDNQPSKPTQTPSEYCIKSANARCLSLPHWNANLHVSRMLYIAWRNREREREGGKIIPRSLHESFNVWHATTHQTTQFAICARSRKRLPLIRSVRIWP